jgi:hypothetical protein
MRIYTTEELHERKALTDAIATNLRFIYFNDFGMAEASVVRDSVASRPQFYALGILVAVKVFLISSGDRAGYIAAHPS